MKKTIILVCSAIIALLSFYSCEKNVQLEQKESTSSPTIYAYDATSKTTLGTDWKVSWDSGDALSVFNAAAGGTTYSDNCKFLIDGTPSEGKFIKDPSQTSKSLIDGESSYDWYACSPYMEYGANPGGTKGYTVALAPKQVGYNSTAHITSNDIMAGTAFGVADGTAPSIPLHHVGTIMKFTVTNNTGEAAAITGLTLDATAGGSYITGSFTMNWGDSSTQPSLDATQMGSAKAYTCALSVVKNTGTAESPVYVATDETIANGASVDLYMVVAPFTIPAGSKIKLTITGSKGTCELEKTMGSAIKFEAGKYNTAAISYSNPVAVLFKETFGTTAVGTGNVATYNKAGLTLLHPEDASSYSYGSYNNASFQTAAYTGQTTTGAYVRYPKANASITIKGIVLHGATSLNFSYRKDAENTSTTVTKWRFSDESSWNEIASSDATGIISHDFTIVNNDNKTIDIQVQMTSAVTNSKYPVTDDWTLKAL